MEVSVNLNKTEYKIAVTYSKKMGMSLKMAMKKIFFETIEDEYDSLIAEKALEDYDKNPKTYTLKELIEELDTRKAG